MSELYSEFLKHITNWQYLLNKTISSNIRSINDENILSVYLLIIGIAFLYGLIHAAGPGHGKALAALYFTKGDHSYKDAFKLGFTISVIHALSALSITFILFFIVKTMFRQNFNEFTNNAMIVSGIMIILVGIYILYESIKNKNKHQSEKIDGSKSIYAVALSIGIVPCPGVMSIVLFCIILKKFTLGILAAVAMSIGMGLTISLAGILSVLFAKRTKSFINKKAYILQILSGFLIIVLGLFLLLPYLHL